MTDVYREISITTISAAGTMDAEGLRKLCKAASAAAWLIFFGMLIHLVNASYLEPTYLGFVDKAKDYGDMSKIQNAFESCSMSSLHMCSFTYSGYAHMVNGLMMMLLGVGVLNLFRYTNPVLAQLAFVAALLSGIGFFATGVTDIPGTAYTTLLRNLNPDHNTAILLMATVVRGYVNIIGITGLGLFAAFTGRAALKSGLFSKWGAWWGYLLLLPALGGLVNPILGFTYLMFVVPWMVWLGLQFRKISR